MSTRKPTLRGNVFDTWVGIFVIVLVLVNTIGAAVNLIARPDRPAWQIAFDWITIAAFVAGVALGIKVHRAAMARVYQIEAERRARLARAAR